jgi:hypothetical protein
MPFNSKKTCVARLKGGCNQRRASSGAVDQAAVNLVLRGEKMCEDGPHTTIREALLLLKSRGILASGRQRRSAPKRMRQATHQLGSDHSRSARITVARLAAIRIQGFAPSPPPCHLLVLRSSVYAKSRLCIHGHAPLSLPSTVVAATRDPWYAAKVILAGGQWPPRRSSDGDKRRAHLPHQLGLPPSVGAILLIGRVKRHLSACI